MAINLDNIFKPKTDLLLLREKKAEIISSNIANADTPGYKAVSVDFSAALKQAQQVQSVKMLATHEAHISPDNNMNNNIKYQIPEQPDTGDGNTVDVAKERNDFLQNSLEYQFTLRNIDGMIKGISKALKGGSS
ncbi:flagellar basal body rod protein FlgB [Thalassomonas actiniarum]|uniref:Flagellar basal body rod protein FlgB n=1 Tax=Thalassomonas actiniarum TaxID=485447 RepID=A0AAE9YXA5_9GAMM|nr:flagellar basal body rod protein FlgB [Thalassomonas actiniarum]WDE02105.1 flagellar basal body rod protein FlgB [Thalassomonas actiniarum]